MKSSNQSGLIHPGLQRRQPNSTSVNNLNTTIPSNNSVLSLTNISMNDSSLETLAAVPSHTDIHHLGSSGITSNSDDDDNDNDMDFDDCSSYSTGSGYSIASTGSRQRRRRNIRTHIVNQNNLPTATTTSEADVENSGRLPVVERYQKQQQKWWTMNFGSTKDPTKTDSASATYHPIVQDREQQKKNDSTLVLPQQHTRTSSPSKSKQSNSFDKSARMAVSTIWNKMTTTTSTGSRHSYTVTSTSSPNNTDSTSPKSPTKTVTATIEMGSVGMDGCKTSSGLSSSKTSEISKSFLVGTTQRKSNRDQNITLTTDSACNSSFTPIINTGSPSANANGGPNNDKSSTSINSNNNAHRKSTAIFQLLFGACGIFVTYLYYGNVQEDLFRYRDPVDGSAFTFVWFLQLAESSITILIGYIGRQYTHRNLPPSKQVMIQQQSLPTFLFFQSGTCQLLGKAFMAMSLAAGLSFPVVVLAKSAKVVPVMMGQFVLGGSSYSLRDYLFAILIVAGTALLSMGSSTDDNENGGGTSTDIDEKTAHAGSNKNTHLGLILIFMSLIMDGVTGGLQKKLKRETASMVVTTYDFLFYSHSAMFIVAFAISFTTGEFLRGHVFLLKHLNTKESNVLYLMVASCICSAIGQCFIFYVIATFDPLVCTTVTTTRKMASVLYSIMFKGHNLSHQGMIGLLLGMSALGIEMEQQFTKNTNNNKSTTSNNHRNSSTTGSTTTSNNNNTSSVVTNNSNNNGIV